MTASMHGLSNTGRSIGLSLRVRIFLSHPVALIGVLFLCFGMIFPIVFGMAADTAALVHFRDSDPSVTATITNLESTNAKENKRRIYAYHYQYALNGRAHEGTSFSSDGPARVGDQVSVQYVPDAPHKSRIVGMRSAPFSWSVIPFTLIFPLMGAGMLYFAMRRFRKHLHLARYGIVTTGQVGRREATNMKINQQQVYRVYFTFSDASGKKHESHVDTHEVGSLVDEHAEPLLYDKAQPEKAVLIDSLPAALRQALAAAL